MGQIYFFKIDSWQKNSVVDKKEINAYSPHKNISLEISNLLLICYDFYADHEENVYGNTFFHFFMF